MSDCTHMVDGDPATCADCRGLHDVADLTATSAFHARFEGRCHATSCVDGGRIAVDDLIVGLSDGSDTIGYRHADCRT